MNAELQNSLSVSSTVGGSSITTLMALLDREIDKTQSANDIARQIDWKKCKALGLVAYPPKTQKIVGKPQKNPRRSKYLNSAERKKKAVEMYNNGFSTADIATEIGVTGGTVAYYIDNPNRRVKK